MRGQFGEMFVHDTLELARREQGMRLEGTDNPAEVSDWDIERYGEVG
uniref:Unannotated protein n=1 Tax=freshwater metagenome TaxID=449393 RepID=A0A6J5Z7Y3_9ZZZZ